MRVRLTCGCGASRLSRLYAYAYAAQVRTREVTLLTAGGADIMPDLLGVAVGVVSAKFAEKLVREALEGVGVELRAKAEISDKQLKALGSTLESTLGVQA